MDLHTAYLQPHGRLNLMGVIRLFAESRGFYFEQCKNRDYTFNMHENLFAVIFGEERKTRFENTLEMAGFAREERDYDDPWCCFRLSGRYETMRKFVVSTLNVMIPQFMNDSWHTACSTCSCTGPVFDIPLWNAQECPEDRENSSITLNQLAYSVANWRQNKSLDDVELTPVSFRERWGKWIQHL